MEPKYPNITVKLIGKDGHPLAIMARVKRALEKAGVSSEDIKLYMEESFSGDYNNVLVTAMKWVNVV